MHLLVSRLRRQGRLYFFRLHTRSLHADKFSACFWTWYLLVVNTHYCCITVLKFNKNNIKKSLYVIREHNNMTFFLLSTEDKE